MTETEKEIARQYELWTGKEPESLYLLPASGSARKYYRIIRNGESVLGVCNENTAENQAYFSFSLQFARIGLNVPALCHVACGETIYFVQDLGDCSLFSVLPDPWPQEPGCRIDSLYRTVIDHLARFQTAPVTYTKVYPVAAFDRTSMMWDLNYFKYFFLKLSGTEFSEPLLEKDFENLCDFLSGSTLQGFLYRDFQSRNILLKGDQPWFIDFQGGRKGPLAYDLVSLLYDAKANLPENFRRKLMEYYLGIASERIPGFAPETFQRDFHACLLLRILQAMGTYGLRGLHQKKDLFLKSIPFAIRNFSSAASLSPLPFQLPEIERIFKTLNNSRWASFQKPGSTELHVSIFSFSLKSGNLPSHPDHGGGFVFDCRFLPNPGRFETYKDLSGLDSEVIRFLSARPQVADFLQNCLQVVKPAILNYIERGFESLSLSFGCTGGRHRSVYCAESMARLLRQEFDVAVSVHHLNLPGKPAARSGTP